MTDRPGPQLCPGCASEMVAGEARIHSTFLGFLLFGLSHEHLWFAPQDARNREARVLHSGERRIAWRCSDCDTTLIGPADVPLDPASLSRPAPRQPRAE